MNTTEEEKKADDYEDTELNENVRNDKYSDEINAGEQIDSLDQLFDGKEKVINEFDVSGNIAQTQTFIQTVKNLHLHMSNAEPVKTKVPLDKRYDLCNPEECIEFVEQFRYSEYLAVAIILCTFHMVALGDLPNLQSKLMEHLPSLKEEEEEGKQHVGGNPYLSLNSVLAVIGGERFTTDTGQQCVTLGDDSIKALKNIVEQFPMLRKVLVSWLIDINRTYEYHTTLDIYQITTALARVIALDIKDAEHRIFTHLYARKENVVLLGGLFYYLYEYKELREKVKAVYLKMLKSSQIWLLESNCIACSFFAEAGIEFPLENELKKQMKRNLFRLQGQELYFLAGILFKTRKFRDIVISSFSDAYSGFTDKVRKIGLAQLYLTLLRFGYYQIKPAMHILPLVACDSREQQEELRPLLEQIMWTRRLRKQLYIILKAYIRDLSRFKVSETVMLHISAFFYNLTLAGPDYKEDVFSFLDEMDNGTAKEILRKLR